jgi:hypothetical protein
MLTTNDLLVSRILPVFSLRSVEVAVYSVLRLKLLPISDPDMNHILINKSMMLLIIKPLVAFVEVPMLYMTL